jgi:hypothetical protein
MEATIECPNSNITLELTSHFVVGGYIRKGMGVASSVRRIDIVYAPYTIR